MKKPVLTVIRSDGKPASTPPILGKSGAKLWQSIQSEYRIDDAGGRAILLQICLTLDRADECAEALDGDGVMIRTKSGGLRDHPLLKLELASRSFVVKSLHKLGLDIEPSRATTGRPPGTFNPTRGA
jgi:hypothetical protein